MGSNKITPFLVIRLQALLSHAFAASYWFILWNHHFIWHTCRHCPSYPPSRFLYYQIPTRQPVQRFSRSSHSHFHLHSTGLAFQCCPDIYPLLLATPFYCHNQMVTGLSSLLLGKWVLCWWPSIQCFSGWDLNHVSSSDSCPLLPRYYI